MTRLAVAFGLLVAVEAHAEVLRLASVAPEGTSYARELRAFGHKIEALTHGAVHVKWYFGGIAGDEVEVVGRIRRDQLDGIASGGNVCTRLAPSLLVLRVPGMVQDSGEAAYLYNRMKPLLDQEFRANGYANVAEVGMGTAILFSRNPIRSFDDLRRTHMFVWRDDEVGLAAVQAMGLQPVLLPIGEADAAYQAGKIDTIDAPPTAALAFQWSTMTKYYTDLRFNYVTGCMLISNRALDRLPAEAQAAVRAAGAELQVRLSDSVDTADRQLVDGLFRKQGLTPVHADDRFRGEFLSAARYAREKLVGKLLPTTLVEHVLTMLADYRAERTRIGP